MNGQTEGGNSDSSPNASTFAPAGGLGNLGAFASGLRSQSPAPPSGRERVRNVWSGLRERMRMRPNAEEDTIPTRFMPAHAGEAGGAQNRTRPDGTTMDAREVMLAEMARAFNLGLGLSEEADSNASGDSTNIPVSDTTMSGSSPTDAQRHGVSMPGQELRTNRDSFTGRQGLVEPPESAEGSFERFLVDLQADLRIALSGPEVFTDHSVAHAPQPSNLPPTNSRPPDALASESNRDSSMPLPTFRATVTDEHNDETSLEQESSNDEHGDNGDNDAYPETHGSGPLRGGAITEPGSNTTSRTEYRPGGGINWWRSYRFPAITTPQTHGSVPTGATGSSSNPSSTTSGATPTASTSTSDPLLSQQIGGGDTNTVIPVILVGLQSVNMDDRGGGPVGALGEHDHDHDDIFGNANTAGDHLPDGGDVNIGGTWPADGEPGTTHGHAGTPPSRSWQSRAANALRNLRPGRRAARTAQNEAAGSRTFLIYVIGGAFAKLQHEGYS